MLANDLAFEFFEGRLNERVLIERVFFGFGRGDGRGRGGWSSRGGHTPRRGLLHTTVRTDFRCSVDQKIERG